jgi:large-conductance mechanosensitive channel
MIVNQFDSSISQFKSFIIENSIVGTSAGVCVGLAAKDAIQTIVNDIILPYIIILFHYFRIESITKFLPGGKTSEPNITNFIKQIVTFLLTVLVSFLFVKLAFDYLLGIDISKRKDNGFKKEDNSKKDNNKEDFGSLMM